MVVQANIKKKKVISQESRFGEREILFFFLKAVVRNPWEVGGWADPRVTEKEKEPLLSLRAKGYLIIAKVGHRRRFWLQPRSFPLKLFLR